MREAPAQTRPALDDAAVDHARHAERRLQREPERLHQVVLLESLAAEHRRRGVDEERHVERGGRLPHRVQGLVVEVPPVDVAADLDARELERSSHALQLLHREIGRLQRQRAGPQEAVRMPRHDGRDVVVLHPAELGRRRPVGRIAEQRRGRREHLPLDARLVHVGDAPDGIEGVGAQVPIERLTRDRAGTASSGSPTRRGQFTPPNRAAQSSQRGGRM